MYEMTENSVVVGEDKRISAFAHLLPVMYELDDRNEWTDPAAWIKANPALGAIKKTDDLTQKVERANRLTDLVRIKSILPASASSIMRLNPFRFLMLVPVIPSSE